MRKFSDLEFGYADAEKEFNRIPDIFEESFYDPKNIVDKLMNKHHFLLVGRKGVGKSAVNSKIRYICGKGDSTFTFPLQLNDFEYTTFSKTSIDKDALGTQKYKESWEFILLITCVKILHNKFKMGESEELRKLVNFLEKIGFSVKLDLNYKKNVTWLSKIKLGASIASFDIEFKKEFGVEPKTYLERISLLNERMTEVITNLYMNERKILVLIDGVDDILRLKKNQLNILSSLIRTVDYLNEKFFSHKSDIKIILCIREDILAIITDPDLNKIKRDGSIIIDWSSAKDDLKKVVELRFQYSGVSKTESESLWYTMFPKKVRNKDSWDHVLDHTLYKPRDILQFLKSCQDLFPDSETIGYKEMRSSIKAYSKDYFIEEMKNEVTGFVNDDLINILPSVFQRIGDNKFSYSEFVKHFKQQNANSGNHDDQIKHLLILLYESGYVGQLIQSQGKYGRGHTSVIFKYRNPNSQIDMSQTFIVHQGIQAGLGIKIK